ncbi:expressed unknown protein [Seminavis robusta]|uniref:Uncharacterized protein n=1 Tax=Seminavis robusta TaxID=568900 RepID=A0A9N8EUY9_9STRA|nr:expressed unknown protein [Seminavis robusta]|eukprot:Sro1955_g307680.1 n/a (409) ;mRNA; f:3843-5069
MPRLECDNEYYDQSEFLQQIQLLSPLHKLVVTHAPLDLIRYAYNKDPEALNADIIYDACRFNTNPEILDFLLELAGPDSLSLEEIASSMHEIIDDYIDVIFDRTGMTELFERLRPLAKRFPRAFVYAEAPEKLSPLASALQMDMRGEYKFELIRDIPSTTEVLNFGDYITFHDAYKEDIVPREVVDTTDALVSRLNKMTDLQSLKLKICYQDEKLIDPVCNLIASGKLKSLVVSAAPENADEDPLSFFSPIFNSIKGSALREFGLLGLQDSNLANSHQDLILEILKSNFTLRQAHISALPAYEDCSNRSKKQRAIDYYTTLNRYGRSRVRNPESQLIEIVDNLAQAAQQSEPEHPTWTSAVPVIYGLLREAPGKWSVSAAAKQIARPRRSPRLKRKASHSLNRNLWVE